MRFKSTLVLLAICIGLGAYLYFYEIKGGERRDKAKQEENRIWKLDSNAINRVEIAAQGQNTIATRIGDRDWEIVSPRRLQADPEELNRIAGSAADISSDAVVEQNPTGLEKFGLQPPKISLKLQTKDNQSHEIHFGTDNPTGSGTYAYVPGRNNVLLVGSSVANAFDKKTDDLRNRAVLIFDQADAQKLEIHNPKGGLNLSKEGDRWWITGKDRLPVDASSANDMLSALSSGRIKEFFDDNPDEYASLGFDKPVIDLKLGLIKNGGQRRLLVGIERSKLLKKGDKKPAAAPSEGSAREYLAKDESRPELFFVDQDLVDKMSKSPADIRDKALAAFQRWDIDSITLISSTGTLAFTKSGSDWVLGPAKKSTQWEAVNGILDAVEKPVKEFVENPGPPSAYGLDKPEIRVILKQGPAVRVACSFGNETANGVYARVAGEDAIKVAEKDTLSALRKGESDFLQPASGEKKK